MNQPLSDERREELREKIRTGDIVLTGKCGQDISDLLALLDAPVHSGAQKCPVCDGDGWRPADPSPGTANPARTPCHSCNGAGWIYPYAGFCFSEVNQPAPPAEATGPRYILNCQCADCRSDRARSGRPAPPADKEK